MTSMELLNSLNSIRDRYILEAKDIGNKGKSRNTLPSSGPAAEPLPFSAEKTSRRYQAKDSTKRKKNGLKRLLVLSTAAGLLLAALAGRGTIAGWADYFETFLNRTENPYQYTQPADITTPSQPESAFEDDANTPSIDGTPPSLEAAAEEHLQLLFGDQYPFYFLETNREEFSLSDYCTEESERLGLSVGITRYALLDLDGDDVPEGVVDFRYGENEQVMSLVLKYQESGVVFATEFSYRQMYQLKSDGTFHASGGEDTDGWYKLRWENMSWVMDRVSDEEDCESKPDAPWQSYAGDQMSSAPAKDQQIDLLPLGAYEGTYNERVKFHLENKPNPEQLQYALIDMDGNGMLDLLIGRNGMIRHAYMSDGAETFEKPFNPIMRRIKMTDYGTSDTTNAPSYIEICEGNRALYVYEETDGCTSYMIAGVVNGEMDWIDILKEDPTQNLYYRLDPHTYSESAISESEFQEALDACVPIDVELKPLTQYPFADS